MQFLTRTPRVKPTALRVAAGFCKVDGLLRATLLTFILTTNLVVPAKAQNAVAEPAPQPAATAASAPAADSNTGPVSAVKKAEDLKSLLAICRSVRARIEKDHRVRLSEESYRGEKRVHIYLCLSEQPLPYTVSLGWFTAREETDQAPVKGKSGLGSILKKPVQVSLGKARDLLNPVTDKNRFLVAVDELGLTLPMPGSEPREKNYDKAAWSTVLGFDHLGVGGINSAEKDFKDAIKIAPINARFNNNMGSLLAAKGDYTNASPHFDRAIRENENYAAAYANRAFLSLAIGHPKLALDDAKKALSIEPTLITARVAYSRALMETGSAPEALKVAQSVKAEAPAEWQSMLLLADALLANKEFKESRTTLARLIVLSPGNAELVLKLAHANEKIGDLDEAIKQARKATQLAPDDSRTHLALARYLDSNRDANAARIQYERALDLKPDSGLRKSAMGAILRLLISTSKLPIADESSKKWVKEYPDDAACHYNRAWIASQLEGDHSQECIDEYRKALEQQPSLTSVHYNLALILIKAGKKAEALKELKSFVAASPEDSDSASARELIKKLEGNG